MKIFLQQANILDIPADVLICSANVSLNLTGGVGADIVSRFGNAMQAELHEQIYNRSPKFAKQGEVYKCYTAGLPYNVVLHAVAVDPMYHSSPEIITKTVRRALLIAKEHNAKIVALTALASGFGDLTLEGFAEGMKPLMDEDFNPIEKVIIPQIQDYRFKELREAFPEADVI